LICQRFYPRSKLIFTKANIKDISNKRKFNQKDFTDIYSTYNSRIFEFLLKRVSSKEIAEDLTSEIFEKIYKTINDFQWQGVTLSAWLFRIARNHLIDYYRKNNKFKNDTSLDEIIDIVVSNNTPIEKEIEENENEVNLFKSISDLEQEDQYLIYYKFYEEMSNKQISELTGISETNIGTKLHRIRKKLAKNIIKYENTK
jgi:RNA polymerase sigma-70 factor (ECF subfamily)